MLFLLQVVFDRMKGMALILYNNIEYAQAAVKDTKGWKIGGSKIKVSEVLLCDVDVFNALQTVRILTNPSVFFSGGLCQSGKSDGFLSFNAGIWTGYSRFL